MKSTSISIEALLGLLGVATKNLVSSPICPIHLQRGLNVERKRANGVPGSQLNVPGTSFISPFTAITSLFFWNKPLLLGNMESIKSVQMVSNKMSVCYTCQD